MRRAEVETATGAVPADGLGFVLPHEHLVWAEAGWQADAVPVPAREDVVAAAAAVLERAAASGVATVVDPTPPEMGRDVALMAEASRRTGVRVVFGTGLYCRWPTPYFAHRTAGELADFFCTELTAGVGADRARPAFVKLAVESGAPTPHEAAALEAGARAHRDLDVPLLVHCQPGAALPVLRRLVGDLGVDGGAVVIGHAETDTDLGRLLEVVEGFGAYVGIDRCGTSAFGLDDDLRLELVAALCALGHAGRVHLAHDTATMPYGRGGDVLAGRLAEMPEWRIDHVGTRFLPRLRAAGVGEDDVRRMTVEAPARWLSRG